MPYLILTSEASHSSSYRCSPIIVGDKFADPEIMRFLGAKLAVNYPEPNSTPKYVVFATLRSVLDALETLGYVFRSVQEHQGYNNWILHKSLDVENDQSKNELSSRPKEATKDEKSPSTDSKLPVASSNSTSRMAKTLANTVATSTENLTEVTYDEDKFTHF